MECGLWSLSRTWSGGVWAGPRSAKVKKRAAAYIGRKGRKKRKGIGKEGSGYEEGRSNKHMWAKSSRGRRTLLSGLQISNCKLIPDHGLPQGVRRTVWLALLDLPHPTD